MMNAEIVEQLRRLVGPENIAVSPEELLCYSYDGTSMEYLPEAVAFPGSTAEVSAIMRLATQEKFSVTPRGAGTGMSGGALPRQGGLVLAMSRLNRILEIDVENMVALVQPGVITGELQQEVRRLGLYYPPDPASLKFCTMGGNVAECAGGPSAVKYGVTRDYILGLEVVLPDGRVLNTGVRTAKGVVGYDLTRLFVGSEGTLGVITSITLKLLACPLGKRTFLLLSRDLGQAAALVSRILSSWLPCTLEYMDRTALSIVSSLLPFPLPEEAAALLLLELDGDEYSLVAQSEHFMEFLRRQPGILVLKQADSREEVESLWAARRAVSPAAFKLKPDKLSEDVVVPRSRIPELVTFIENLSRGLDIIIFTFGHAGDGNIHVNIMLDKKEPREVAQAAVAKKAIFEQVLQLKGTLSGEHGVGLTKADFLALELDSNAIAVMRQLKNLFDPANILNPGKIFPG